MTNQTASAEPELKGIDYAQINLTTLTTALKEAGIKVTAKHDTAQRVKLLQDYELSQAPNDDELPEQDRKLGSCSVCFAVSQLSRPACPFCGTSEDQPTADAPVQAPPPKSPKAAAKAKAEKAPKEPTAPKEEAPTKEEKAIVKADAGKITKKNVQEIEGLERRIKGLLADSLGSHWKLGRELQGVMESGAWKYRVGETGKPVFSGFGDWVHKTFGLTPQHARGLMAVSLAYTEKQVREVGMSKLQLILRVPPEVRGKLEEHAADASLADVREEVQRLAPGGTRAPLPRGDAKARSHTRALGAEQATAKRIKAANEVTAVFVLNRYELPMFARAKSIETGEPVRARTINADPHGVLELHNGVQIHVQIVEDENGIGVVLDFKRESEEAAAE
jgi:hypothetical protein